MSIGYHILHSYVACKVYNHKNIQDLCSGDSSMVNWNHAMDKTEAARMLYINPPTRYRKTNKYGIAQPS